MNNRPMDWTGVLNNTNARLQKYGVSLDVEPEDNTYTIMIIGKNKTEDYACGYYENELAELIEDAYSYIINSKDYNNEK